jgi:hypothetical protein
MKITYGVCVSSWGKLSAHFRPNFEPVASTLHALHGEAAIAPAYNRILDACSFDDTDVLILQHDDLEILDPDGVAKLIAPFEDPSVTLVGVAGGDGTHGLAWWNHNPIGHQRTDLMNINFGKRTGDVDLLEGSLLVFSRWAIRNLRFDGSFPGFHGYDEIAMQVKGYFPGRRNVVVDVDTHHHNSMGFKSPESHAEWFAADELYRKKWNLV